MPNIYDEVELPQNIKRMFQERKKETLVPWTQQQWDMLEEEYLKIQRKESKQPAAQRAKIVEQFENMLAYKYELDLLLKNPQLRMKVSDHGSQSIQPNET